MQFVENLENIRKHKEENNNSNRPQPHYLKIYQLKQLFGIFPSSIFLMHFNIVVITLHV